MICFKKQIIFLIVLCLYSFLFLLLILYWMYTENSPSNAELESKEDIIHLEEKKPHTHEAVKIIPVEIWGKASISLYLWQHILKGPLNSEHNGFMKVGNLTLDGFQFSFKNGPGFIQSTVPRSVKHLVLVLNGRSPDKVKQSVEWLKFVRTLKSVKRVCLVMLGNEQCDNSWILPYMRSKGGFIDVAFLVYDSPLIDNKEFFQWPLGVAEYRGFPDIPESSTDLLSKRPFTANFVGTIYKSSSRESLVNLIKANKWTDKIRLIERSEWMPNETPETRQQYLEALQRSDLTLSPVGRNTECYRIYEAMSVGSVPVVEDAVTPGQCARGPPGPVRLLRHLQAPVIWLRDWAHLPDLLVAEQTLTFREITRRRIRVINWYHNFKRNMKTKFLQVLKNKFLY